MAVITTSDLTTKQVNGTGVFDELMNAMAIQLDTEFKKGRIKGSDYATVYLGAMTSVVQQSITFLLGKQQADKQAELLQAQVDKTVKETLLVQSQIANTDAGTNKITADIGLVNQDTVNATAQHTVITTQGSKLAEEVLMIAEQKTNTIAQRSVINSTNDKLVAEVAKLTKDLLYIDQQIASMTAQANKTNEEVGLVTNQKANALVEHSVLTNNANKLAAEALLVGQNKLNAQSQKILIDNQATKTSNESNLLAQKSLTEKAQIEDIVTGTTPVTGIIGRQKFVYDKQIAGFDRDAEQKAAKIYTDLYKTDRSTATDPTTVNRLTGFTDKDTGYVMARLAKGVGVTTMSPPGVKGNSTSPVNVTTTDPVTDTVYPAPLKYPTV